MRVVKEGRKGAHNKSRSSSGWTAYEDFVQRNIIAPGDDLRVFWRGDRDTGGTADTGKGTGVQFYLLLAIYRSPGAMM